MIFKDSLKSWFYHNDSNAAKADARVCLLDANGNPSRSDNVLRVLSYSMCKDDFVDMGLPSGTLWAKKNLGATSETDYGMYASWGNLELHAEGDGYDFSPATYNNTPAATINADLSLEQDIAHQTLGGGWRMPTSDEFVELFNSEYTTNAWVTDYQGISGLKGILVTSNTNGNTLFFPAAGFYYGNRVRDINFDGNYFSSTLVSSTSVKEILIRAAGVQHQNCSRNIGLSIRPVI